MTATPSRMQIVQDLNALLDKTFKSKLTKHDRRLFRGTAVEVFPDTTDEGILSSAHANFKVETTDVKYTTPNGTRSSSNKIVWYRDDNDQELGVFGTRRHCNPAI